MKPSKHHTIIASTATSDKADEIAREFGVIASRSTRCAKSVAHYVFASKTSERLSDDDWRKVVCAAVTDTGADAYVAIRHRDTDHDHIHLIMSRVTLSGKAWSDSNERRRMRKVCLRMEIELGLTRTPARSSHTRPRHTKAGLERTKRLNSFRENKDTKIIENNSATSSRIHYTVTRNRRRLINTLASGLARAFTEALDPDDDGFDHNTYSQNQTR